jgi:hypothetical protein
MRWRTEDDRPLRKTTTTAATPRTLHTSPTVARRLRREVFPPRPATAKAKSPIVIRMTRGTRIAPSRSCGTTNQRRLHHDSSRSRIPRIRGKKTGASAVATAPTQRRPLLLERPSGAATTGDATPLQPRSCKRRQRPLAGSSQDASWTFGGRRASDPSSKQQTERARVQRLFESPLTDSNRRPPPYHGGFVPLLGGVGTALGSALYLQFG